MIRIDISPKDQKFKKAINQKDLFLLLTKIKFPTWDNLEVISIFFISSM
jgi:hypothetical protein